MEEGDAPEPEHKKLRAIVEQLEQTVQRQDVLIRKDAPGAFINILKFLNIYELETIYKMLSKDMRSWWDRNDVWKSLCIMKMGEKTFDEVTSYISYMVYDPRTHRPLRWEYKWVLIAWEFYTALSRLEYMDLTVKQPFDTNFETSGTYTTFRLSLENGEVFMEAADDNRMPCNTIFFMHLMGSISAGGDDNMTAEVNIGRGETIRRIKISGKDIYYPFIYVIFQRTEGYLRRTDYQKRPNWGINEYRAIRSCIVCGNEAKVMIKNDPNKTFCNKTCWEKLK